MPLTVVSRPQRACIAFAILAAIVPGLPVKAAINAALDPEATRDAAPFVFTMPEGAVSLTGFHCSIIESEEAAAFAADPDYSETPPTIGLELFVDAAGLTPLSSGRGGHDEPLSDDMKSPLSARLSRIIVGGDVFSLTESAVLEEVSLPEASMSVADLVGRCHP